MQGHQEEKYYHTERSVQEYITLAKDVNGLDLILQLNKILPQESSLLELGSGPGTDWKILDEYYNVTGSDYSREFLKHLTSTYPDGDFLHLDAATLDTSKKFDGIYSNKVLHHLTDSQLQQSVQRQRGVLNQGGIICHSFWKGEGSETFKGMFVNYHREPALRALFGECFEIISVSAYKEFEANDSLLLIAKKRI
jgi:trans-aconitate methyltransferase